ncbi:hypothetical protein D3C77_260200 [compost metagenome]
MRFEATHLGLERARVDLEQQVTFVDLSAFGESDLINLPGDPWPHFYGLGGFQATGELIPFIDRLLQYLGHADLGRRLCLDGFRGTTAGTHHQYCK